MLNNILNEVAYAVCTSGVPIRVLLHVVLVSAGPELIFLPAAAVFWI